MNKHPKNFINNILGKLPKMEAKVSVAPSQAVKAAPRPPHLDTALCTGGHQASARTASAQHQAVTPGTATIIDIKHQCKDATARVKGRQRRSTKTQYRTGMRKSLGTITNKKRKQDIHKEEKAMLCGKAPKRTKKAHPRKAESTNDQSTNHESVTVNSIASSKGKDAIMEPSDNDGGVDISGISIVGEGHKPESTYIQSTKNETSPLNSIVTSNKDKDAIATPTDDNDEGVNTSNEVAVVDQEMIKILPNDTWKVVYSKLKKLGWTWTNGTGLVDFVYWKPGFSSREKRNEGKLNEDYFESEAVLKEYVVKKYGWIMRNKDGWIMVEDGHGWRMPEDQRNNDVKSVEELYDSVKSDFKELGFLKKRGASTFNPIIQLDPRELSHSSVFLAQWNEMVKKVQNGETEMKRLVYLYGQYDENSDPIISLVEEDEIIKFEEGTKEAQRTNQGPLFDQQMKALGNDWYTPANDRLGEFFRKEAEKNIPLQIRNEYGQIFYAKNPRKGPFSPVVVVSVLTETAPEKVKKEYFDIISQVKEENTPIKEMKRLVFRYGWNSFEIIPSNFLISQREGETGAKSLHKVPSRIRENAKKVEHAQPFEKKDHLLINALYHLKHDRCLGPQERPTYPKEEAQENEDIVLRKLMNLLD